MENKFLIDLAVKYGLLDWQIVKITNCAHFVGANGDFDKFKRIAEYICENKIVDEPEDVIAEELRRNAIV